MLDYLNTLQKLCAVTAPSGFEGPAAQVAAELLCPWMDEVTVHPMGSVIGLRRCGKKNAKNAKKVLTSERKFAILTKLASMRSDQLKIWPSSSVG